jgi:hypothetical protein
MPEAARQSLGCLVVGKAIFNVVTGLALATLGTFVLTTLPKLYAESGARPSVFTAPFIQQPWLFVLLCLPAIAGGVWLLVSKRYRWIVMVLSTLFLVAGAILIVVAMIQGMAPLYAPQSL